METQLCALTVQNCIPNGKVRIQRLSEYKVTYIGAKRVFWFNRELDSENMG